MSDNTERLEAEIRTLRTRFDAITEKLDQRSDKLFGRIADSEHSWLVWPALIASHLLVAYFL